MVKFGMKISTSDLFQTPSFSLEELAYAKQKVETRALYNYEKIHELSLEEPVFEREAQKLRQPQAWHVSHNGWTVGHFSFWPWLGASDDTSFPPDSMGVFAISPQGETFRIPEATFQRLLKSLAAMTDTPTDDMLTRWVANWVDQNKGMAQATLWMDPRLSSQSARVAMHLGIRIVGAPPEQAPRLTQSDPQSAQDFQRLSTLWQKSCFKQTSAAFQAALGPLLPRLQALGASTTSVLAWVQEGHVERRLQAMELLPAVLASLVDKQWKRPSAGETQAPMAQSLSRIGRLIDDGQPWYEALAEALAKDHVSTEADKLPDLPVDYQATVVRGLHRLSRLPLEQRPTMDSLDQQIRSGGGFGSFLPPYSPQNHFHTHGFGRLLWACGMVEMVDLPRTPQQFWAMDQVLTHVFCFENRKVLDYNQAKAYRSAFRGLTGLPVEPSEWLVPWDTLHKVEEGQREIEDWVADAFEISYREKAMSDGHIDHHLSLKQLLDGSQTLHRFHQQATLRVSAKQTEQLYALEQGQLSPMWEPGGPVHATDGDVTITALLHPVALLKEGKELSHCVSGYAPQCFSGESRIFAFLDSSGERATLEVQQTEEQGKDRWSASQIQLYGIENSEPSLKLKAAARRFIQRLNQEYCQSRWPDVEMPEQWEEQDVSKDPIFKQQVKAWMKAKHPRLFEDLFRLSAPAPVVEQSVSFEIPVPNQAPRAAPRHGR